MAKRSPKRAGPTPVESIKHKDARVNIPAEELRGFVATEEERPGKMLYPRDPSLDPQLVWKGKDGHPVRAARAGPRCDRRLWRGGRDDRLRAS